jgi:hypothetical protein
MFGTWRLTFHPIQWSSFALTADVAVAASSQGSKVRSSTTPIKRGPNAREARSRMTDLRDPSSSEAVSPPLPAPSSRWPLLRWFASSATLAVPQAAGPVAFSLVALSLIDEASGGAAMILAMTLAQVVGAIPITLLGRKHAAATVLRLLVIFRTLALAAVVLCAYFQTPFAWLVAFAALAGLVNGAAVGYLRSLLNHFTPASHLPRALGIAATLNELTFVLGPVASRSKK